MLVIICCVGIAVSQFPAVAVERLTGSVSPHFIPGFGLLATIVGLTALKTLQFSGSCGQGSVSTD